MHPCRLGALIGGVEYKQLSQFNRYGYYLGSAFQIQDDLLNLVGEQDKYGKEIGGDILEGKRTLMLIHLLNHCNNSNKEKLKHPSQNSKHKQKQNKTNQSPISIKQKPTYTR